MPENFRKFAKNSKKLQKCMNLSYLSKEFQNVTLNFSAFGRKTIDLEIFEIMSSKFNRKIELLSYSRKSCFRIQERLAITWFFHNNFSLSGGGLNPLWPPYLLHWTSSPWRQGFYNTKGESILVKNVIAIIWFLNLLSESFLEFIDNLITGFPQKHAKHCIKLHPKRKKR